MARPWWAAVDSNHLPPQESLAVASFAVKPIERLSDQDRLIVRDCLRAAVEGPFFPDWEFHTLFGLTREEVRWVLETWPETGAADVQDTAVRNSLNHLLGYPHNDWEAWRRFISVDPPDVAGVLSRWRGDEAYDETAKGYFNRLE